MPSTHWQEEGEPRLVNETHRATLRIAGRWLFGIFFILAGIGHFVATRYYMKIMPPSLPFPRELVWLSGVFEVVLGVLLLVPSYSRLAAWGLIALLVAVFPANLYLYHHQKILPMPSWLHLARLPVQGVLILWAYIYTHQRPSSEI